ncbi:MAG: hypothetical protein ACJA1A_000339 [Saprospiraceae bacterium]|jgi:hypothetical protein
MYRRIAFLLIKYDAIYEVISKDERLDAQKNIFSFLDML